MDKITINPINRILEMYDNLTEDKVSFIKYSKDVNTNYEFKVIRESIHDGTLSFSIDLMHEVLSTLIWRKCSYKKKPVPIGMMPSYEVGDITIEIEFGNFDINGTIMVGQRETINIPVRTIFEKEDK